MTQKEAAAKLAAKHGAMFGAANKVATKAQKKGVANVFDIALLIALIQALISFFQECRKTPEQLKKKAQRGGLFSRLFSRGKVKKAMIENEISTTDVDVAEMTDAIYETAAEADVEEIGAAVLETSDIEDETDDGILV